MKRSAFTLIELLAVISILMLLLALLAPSLDATWSLARATLCRKNLHRIGTGFAVAKTGEVTREGAQANLVMVYPEWEQWPAVPFGTVPDPRLYQCPEGKRSPSKKATLDHLSYVTPSGISVPLSGYQSEWYIARDGKDERGAYREYLIQDDGARDVSRLSWHGWIDSDGLVRVYVAGWLWIMDHIPQTSDFSGAWAPGAGPTTCGDDNRLFLEGEPAFEGSLKDNRGRMFRINVAGATPTNYGINTCANKYAYGSKVLVLVDSEELDVDPEIPEETQELLNKSARHRGRLNFLTGDGAVHIKGPMEISPELHPEMWQP
jgi:hypothetical protein